MSIALIFKVAWNVFCYIKWCTVENNNFRVFNPQNFLTLILVTPIKVFMLTKLLYYKLIVLYPISLKNISTIN